jgi:ATP-dependent RNA helicase SUPV3L1/SUV3
VFTVVNSMTSLIGASGDDFASILRALGYRLERRPKPPDQLPAPASATAPADEISAVASVDASVANELQTAASAIATESAFTATDSASIASDTASDTVSAASDAVQAEPALAEPQAPVVEDTTATVAPSPSEPEMIEVWRPGRTGDRRRVHARGRGRAKQGETTASAHKTSAETPASEPRTAAVASAEQGAGLTEETAKPDHGRSRRPGRQRRPPHRMERQERSREQAPGRRFEPREKRPDPNSPFAKLAALKAQLEADAKERR